MLKKKHGMVRRQTNAAGTKNLRKGARGWSWFLFHFAQWVLNTFWATWMCGNVCLLENSPGNSAVKASPQTMAEVHTRFDGATEKVSLQRKNWQKGEHALIRGEQENSMTLILGNRKCEHSVKEGNPTENWFEGKDKFSFTQVILQNIEVRVYHKRD